MKQLECVLLKRVCCLAENVQTPEHHVHMCNIWINYQHPRHGISLSRCLGYLFYYFDFFFSPPSCTVCMIYFSPFSLSKATTKAFSTTIKKLVLFSFYPEWIWTSVSSISTLFFFFFFAHSWGWVSDVHGLFLGLVLLEIEISVQKGQVLRVRSESDYTRAEQMTRVVGEVWVFGKGWVIGESTWPAGAYDGGLVTDALHDGWVTEGLMHDTLHTSPLPSIFFNVKGEPRRLNSSGSLQLL